MNKSVLDIINVQAMIKTIRHSEGTDEIWGYRCMFGGTKAHPFLFTDMSDHPRQKHTANGFTSDAAGAGQFLSTTWDDLAKKLGLKDFSEESQNYAFCELFNEHNALNDICNGHFDVAIEKLNTVWASLPNSKYGQPTNKLSDLAKVFTDNGGEIKNQA